MMLTDLSSNEHAIVTAIEGGAGLMQRLALRGITEGRTLKVISCSRGPIIVEVRGGVLALGRGMARKIRVRRLQ